MKEWRNKKVNGSRGFGLAAKLKIVKSVFKKWQSEVKAEDISLDKLESNLDSTESGTKASGWFAILRDERCKAPSPDRFNVNLIKDRCSDIEGDFMNFMNEFYLDSSKVSSLNHSFITLIPKVVSPCLISNYRLISLVNSFYKVLAKDLSNRLRKVINGVIRESQMTFVKKHQIIDNFVIANKILSNWRREKEWGIVLKLEFEKAYDSVDHKFLDLCLEGTGFSVRWRGWIRSCISSSMVSVLINVCPSKEFGQDLNLFKGNVLVKGGNSPY
ncbi:hypothetical protein Dsin_030105 [Dipteronia sinensis]|uniref:Reverse transcriptase domain-containing protein n=1 Tax=Dipteronia sinensis TaxID=43782 RepID=A0AAD9ZKG5_9ROSI|nr:hypothetical protein Dsin_030105 [Dipteronia sinensis]